MNVAILLKMVYVVSWVSYLNTDGAATTHFVPTSRVCCDDWGGTSNSPSYVVPYAVRGTALLRV